MVLIDVIRQVRNNAANLDKKKFTKDCTRRMMGCTFYASAGLNQSKKTIDKIECSRIFQF
jgi:hypothetical protein